MTKIPPLLSLLLAGCYIGGSGSGSPSKDDPVHDTAIRIDPREPAEMARCPEEESALPFELVQLGYAMMDNEQAVLADQVAYDAWLVELGESMGSSYTSSGTAPDIDFTESVGFANFWVDGGCEDPPTYAACEDGSTIISFNEPGFDDGCDAFFPQVDLLIVPRGSATDFEWGSR